MKSYRIPDSPGKSVPNPAPAWQPPTTTQEKYFCNNFKLLYRQALSALAFMTREKINQA